MTRSLLLTLTLVCLASANPYFDDDWRAQEMEEYLLQRTAEQVIPLEDQTFNTDDQGIGQVSGVDVDSNGGLYVFHRADRPWNSETYQPMTNILTDAAKVPINKDTILKVDAASGRIQSSFGKDMFNVPHGLKFDAHDNMWVTDVGRHQVLRFPKGTTTPDLVLGEKFVPGNDNAHFCKPTDVAIASNGDFFVSDGYCNSRVVKFSSSGQVLTQWGTRRTSGDLTPFTLTIPHSITLIEELDIVCVADRENGRALCYNAGLKNANTTGNFNRTLIPQMDIGKVYAIYYSKAEQEVVAAGLLSDIPTMEEGLPFYPSRAFTYDLEGRLLNSWAYITPEVAKNGPSLIHDLCTSRDGQDFFLADLDQQKVYKYSKKWPSIVG
ncbi:probable peptidyl-alpha-hydroxyglycine alpha-amidating lyase pgal-1 isoform X2 [Physella acuta]|uniref:probable peptidyl-alpha-hydroxyglycine alpha-amidating lyase pgal-1 isoform X2 n=1 Tax=Physella acuta TaxID=109671 RepID=UPI0027DAE486|nr:probable peptidyl-alpha-hydroxyglycine alpha-amidating lyase pgal-1 isoform X2 [Physella acuta]